MEPLQHQTIVMTGASSGIGLVTAKQAADRGARGRARHVVVHGCRTAVRPLRSRGGDAVINLGSIVSERAVPLHGISSASRQAVKGDTDALRMAPGLNDATTAYTRARLSPMRFMLPAATAFLLAVVARR